MEKEKRTEQPTVNKPHDKGYKRDLRNPKEFLHFLKKYVKADWTKGLAASQLRLCDKELIGKDYEGKEADLIYEIALDREEKIYVFILQELQSSVDHTMIFRIVMYIMDVLSHYFLSVPKGEREQAGFRLPAVVPIVFYNGVDRWTAVRDFREYQTAGERFGEYVLGLRYHLVDLNEIEEDYILATNTVIDNIMYCDKYRRKAEVAEAVRTSIRRVKRLGNQETEEFKRWVKHILLSICKNKESLVMEILNWAEGDEDMAFQYNIVRMVEDEKAEGRAQGLSEGRAQGLEEGRARGFQEGLSKGELLKTISLLRKKYRKGKTLSEAAEELEEDASQLKQLYDLIAEHPEEEDDRILSRYQSSDGAKSPCLFT